MPLLKSVKRMLAREEFFPGPLSFFLSPYFITRYHLAKAIEARAARMGGRILDFGCGSKPYERLFAHAESYVGVDVEISGHDHGRSRVDHFYVGHHLPFEDSSFDSIVSFEVFEHVRDLDRMVAELSRVAKPGALVLITTPFIFPEHEIPFDFRRLTRYGMDRVLAENGFEIVELEQTTSSVLAIAQCVNHFIFCEATPAFTSTRILTHFLITLPVTIVAYMVHFFLPKGSSLYVNLVAVARRRDETVRTN